MPSLPPHVGIRTIRTRPDGLAYRQLRWTVEGVEHTEAIGWTTQEAAEALAERQRSALLLGVSRSSRSASPVAVESLVLAFLSDLERRGTGSERYRRMVAYRCAYLLRHLGAVDAHALTVTHLDEYVATRRREAGGRGNRPPRRATVQSELRTLRRIVSASGLWPGMPRMSGWPDDATPARAATVAEVERLANAAPPPLARLIRFAAACPRRPVALFSLQRADCARVLDDAYTGTDLVYFRADKGGRSRGWGPLLPEARAVLRDHLRAELGPADARVWSASRGGPQSAEAFGSQLRILCRRLGLPLVRPYDLRKLACVRAYEAVGRSLLATCRFSGHRSPQTLLRHYLYAEEDLVAAAVRGRAATPPPNTAAGTDAGTASKNPPSTD